MLEFTFSHISKMGEDHSFYYVLEDTWLTFFINILLSALINHEAILDVSWRFVWSYLKYHDLSMITSLAVQAMPNAAKESHYA